MYAVACWILYGTIKLECPNGFAVPRRKIIALATDPCKTMNKAFVSYDKRRHADRDVPDPLARVDSDTSPTRGGFAVLVLYSMPLS